MLEIEQSLSHPSSAFDAAVVGSITNSCGIREINRLIFQSRSKKVPIDNSLIEFLATWISITDERLWDPAISAIRRQLDRSDFAGLSVSAIEIGLLGALAGHPGTWTSNLQEASDVRASNVIFERVKYITVTSVDLNSVNVDFRNSDGAETSVTLSKEDCKRWKTSDEFRGGITSLPEARIGKTRFIVVLAGIPSQNLTVTNNPTVKSVTWLDGVSFVTTLDSALLMLSSCSTRYHSWVGEVVRYVIPTRFEDRSFASSSDSTKNGVVTLSCQKDALRLCEMLVHEASHQYYTIARKLGRLHSGSNNELYFSPFTGTERPIGRILLAYHAAANIALFFNDCVISGHPRRHECLNFREAALDTARTLEDSLERSHSLTDLGLSLVKPLSMAIKRL